MPVSACVVPRKPRELRAPAAASVFLSARTSSVLTCSHAVSRKILLGQHARFYLDVDGLACQSEPCVSRSQVLSGDLLRIPFCQEKQKCAFSFLRQQKRGLRGFSRYGEQDKPVYEEVASSTSTIPGGVALRRRKSMKSTGTVYTFVEVGEYLEWHRWSLLLLAWAPGRYRRGDRKRC